MEDLIQPNQDKTKILQDHFKDNDNKIKVSTDDSNIEIINKWRQVIDEM